MNYEVLRIYGYSDSFILKPWRGVGRREGSEPDLLRRGRKIEVRHDAHVGRQIGSKMENRTNFLHRQRRKQKSNRQTLQQVQSDSQPSRPPP